MMKKIWKVILIISIILCVTGIICGAAAYLMGGSLDELYQNKDALPVLEMLSPSNILNIILSYFGM